MAGLTRAAGGRQGRVWLVASEAGLSGLTRVGGGPGRWIELGQVRESRKKYAAALAAYERAAEVAGGSEADRRHVAHSHYRRARLHAKLKAWPEADVAFAEALRLRPELGTWHGHRGVAREGAEDWPAAAAHFEEAMRLEPERTEWLAGLLRTSTAAGKPNGVEQALTVLGDRPDDDRLRRALVTSQVAIGDWPAAAAHLRQLVAKKPHDHGLGTQLADCLDQAYRVPFHLDHTGRVTRTSDEARSAAFDEAAALLEHLIRDDPSRPGPAHKLGQLNERGGRMAEAVEAFRTGMSRLSLVDSWWCFRAAHEWGFRLAYAQHRVEPDAASAKNPKLKREATPVGPAVDDPAGFFELVVAYQGLQLYGFLVPGDWRVVDIYLDDRLLKQVRVDGSAWRPALRFDMTNTLVREFPPTSRLTVRAGGRPLVTTGGTEALELSVPGGSGAVLTKLAAGQTPTKKGGWPRSGEALATRQEQYLTVYERARELLDAQGRKLFLAYGTLLGCHREGRFIPGDDDFDVSYVSHALTPEAFRKECFDIARELLRQGMDVTFSINGRLFKVGLDKVWIDITPLWFYADGAWAFDAHRFDVEAIDPVQTTEFLGRTAYVPNQPDVFLADTYGENWRTPQSDFRYYRSKDDDRILSQMWSKPSEVREFAKLVERDRAELPGAGQFVGVGYPGYPAFSFLISPS
jgi:tetratricopeptide (TPR) repeat protein